VRERVARDDHQLYPTECGRADARAGKERCPTKEAHVDQVSTQQAADLTQGTQPRDPHVEQSVRQRAQPDDRMDNQHLKPGLAEFQPHEP
jgi:hypothetical protein